MRAIREYFRKSGCKKGAFFSKFVSTERNSVHETEINEGTKPESLEVRFDSANRVVYKQTGAYREISAQELVRGTYIF